MSDRIALMAGNWKMHKTPSEGARFVAELVAALPPLDGVEVVVAPSFPGLPAAVAAAEGSPVAVAAQDVFWESEGAYTGEVSVGMLRDAGARYVIIGHSERRQLFGETDEGVARKVRATLDAGLTPIMCVGESESEREAGRTEERLISQLDGGLGHVRSEELPGLVVAYEPIWAIGTGRTATPEIAQETIAFIRARLADMAGAERASQARVLYGGSVKPDNVRELMSQPDIDGGLVGGASLEVDSFLRIVDFRS
ncbi:MAG: triose-phosphate isomerase [Thermoleophilia bacterium]